MSAPTANDLFRHCQDLVRQGQPVFPCKSRGDKAKAPLTRHGVKDATLDVGQIKTWWREHRTAAIGIPTGIKYDVLDVDIKDTADGRTHLTRLTTLGLLDGCVSVARTPSGGWHLYFPASPGMTNKARGATLGLDVRGLGGYVLAAPSYIETLAYSGPYVDLGATAGGKPGPLHWDLIVNSLTPMDEDTNQPVKQLLNYERQSSIGSLRGWLSERTSGERNNSLHWAVCRCIENGIDPFEMYEVASLIGLTDDEINKTINSALKRAGVTEDELDSEIEAMFPDA